MSDVPRQLNPEYLADLPSRPIEEIRVMRSECVALETGLSYLRRMVQANLDIVNREREHRETGEPSELSDLIDELPAILSEGPRGSGVGRLPMTLEPPEVDASLAAELDALVGTSFLSGIKSVPDEDLTVISNGLIALEQRISTRRRAFHECIDALQADLTRRYQSGEASVESLLD